MPLLQSEYRSVHFEPVQLQSVQHRAVRLVTGECIPGNEGDPCDDFNVCTSNDRCQSGECVGTAGGTPPPAGTATPTPTATPVLTKCVGDCDDNGVVTVDEILTGVNIALGNLDVSYLRELRRQRRRPGYGG